MMCDSFHLFVWNGNVAVHDGEDEAPRRQVAPGPPTAFVIGPSLLDRGLLCAAGLQGAGTATVPSDREVSHGSRNHQSRN